MKKRIDDITREVVVIICEVREEYDAGFKVGGLYCFRRANILFENQIGFALMHWLILLPLSLYLQHI